MHLLRQFCINQGVFLPGTRNFDLGERRARPEINVYELSYCPTGRRFAVCSTEGVAIYSLDVVSLFDPFQLDTQTTPDVVRRALSMNDYSTALMASLRLNDSKFITDSLESTSITQIPFVVRSLSVLYAERLLQWMSKGNVMSSTIHVHFYMNWLRELLHAHGMNLKGYADVATLTGIQQIVTHHSAHITKM
uniref:Utp12 domain-containing protein n=1 Tax=Caenorhabditis japonica TaxID=281687 RepID=A0A8R1E3T3_CAEJA